MEAIKALKIAGISDETQVLPRLAATTSPTQPFTVVLEKMLSASEIGSGFNSQLSTIQTRVLSGTKFSSRDLLMLQVQMGRFNMQVELVSKVAESATTTLRKIQNS